MTATSRLTAKYQATIPAPVREVLQLKAGDNIAFDIADGRITLRKARSVDLKFSAAVEPTLTEWTTQADEDAYHDL